MLVFVGCFAPLRFVSVAIGSISSSVLPEPGSQRQLPLRSCQRLALAAACFALASAPALRVALVAMMESASKARIAANMRRLAEYGIDHRIPEHVNAYLVVRQSTARPRPEQILAAIASSRDTHSQGADFGETFVLVRKRHFPEGLPAGLQAWAVSESEVREEYHVPVGTDFTNFYIFGKNTPTADLPKRTKELRLFEALTRDMSGATPGALAAHARLEGRESFQEPTGLQPPALADDDDESAASRQPVVVTAEGGQSGELPGAIKQEHVPPGALATTAASRSGQAAASRSSGSAGVAEASAASRPVPDQARRQRVLKMMHSDEGVLAEDQETASLEELVKKIKKAATAKLFYQANSASGSTVYFWCQQVIGALRAMQPGSPEPQPEGEAPALTAAVAPASAALAPGGPSGGGA